MAIDTRNKRAACIGFLASSRIVFPNPDGSLSSQEDRQQLAYSYPGILAGALNIPVPPIETATLEFDYTETIRLNF